MKGRREITDDTARFSRTTGNRYETIDVLGMEPIPFEVVAWTHANDACARVITLESLGTPPQYPAHTRYLIGWIDPEIFPKPHAPNRKLKAR